MFKWITERLLQWNFGQKCFSKSEFHQIYYLKICTLIILKVLNGFSVNEKIYLEYQANIGLIN